MKKGRRNHSAESKARVALKTIKVIKNMSGSGSAWMVVAVPLITLEKGADLFFCF